MLRLGPVAFPIALASFAIQAAIAQKGTFNLFGYGPGIGGSSLTNTNDTTPDDNTFSNATFYVPTTTNNSATTNSNRQAGFLPANKTASSADMTVAGWQFYGQALLLVGSDGAWNSLFYAEAPYEDGLWTLSWNSTSKDSGAVPLAIRSTPPAAPEDDDDAAYSVSQLRHVENLGSLKHVVYF
ncbi:hypothetical protein C8A01DRAFT_35415 [Parachaetomium inaequale]|uniref:Uncharacterized protein n=1 Tax=Parachaetomium inaequale TaxID=2588326 RepID=A0AAN6SSM3_9PEZI|nr:hypothetical protein C8A01DRAFT_35415 [Parachaetomium inaequale]